MKLRVSYAFTLMELIIVVVLIAVLAAIGLPLFQLTRQRAVDREARIYLKLIHAAQLTERIESGGFVSCADNQECNQLLNLDLLSETAAGGNWDYAVAVEENNFTASASGEKGTTDWKIRAQDDCAWGDDGQYQDQCQPN